MINRFGNYVNAASAAFVQSPNRPWVIGGGTTLGGTGTTTPGGTGRTSVSPSVSRGSGTGTV